MGAGDSPDRRTVDRAVRGDPVAVEEVLRAIRPGIVRYCRARLGAGAGYLEADDVAQVVCVAVYQSLPRYQDQGVPFTAWLYRIAARKVVDAQRNAVRYARAAPIDVPRDVPDQAPGPEQQVESLDLTLRMSKLLAHLPDIQREIIVLRVAVGLQAEEVGAVLGMTAAAVRTAQSRALATLRTLAPAFLEVPE
jgi:RNA polymerase sigma-70 factor (ECF subfamily)